MRPNPFVRQADKRARETRRIVQAGVPPRSGGQATDEDGDVSGSVSGGTVTLYGRLDWTPLNESGEPDGFVLG